MRDPMYRRHPEETLMKLTSSGVTSRSIVVYSAASPLKQNRTSALSGPMEHVYIPYAFYRKREGSRLVILIFSVLIFPSMTSSVIALAVPGALQIPCPWVRMVSLQAKSD
jgi:hypothetical protein